MIKTIQTILFLGLSTIAFSALNTDSLLIELDQAASSGQRAEIYLKLAEIQGKTSLSGGLNWLNHVATIAQQENNLTLQKKVIDDKGALFHRYEKPDSSIIYFWKYLSPLYSKTGRDSSKVYNRIAVYHLALENRDSALLYLNIAAQIHKRIDDPRGLVKTLNNMGTALYGDFGKTQFQNYFEEAYFLALEIEDYEHMSTVHINYLALQYMLHQNPDSLLKSLNKILETPSIQQHPDLKATLYINSALIYLDRHKDIKRAEELFLKALKIYNTSNTTIDPLIYLGLGAVHFEKKQFNKAISYYHKTLDMVISVDTRGAVLKKLTLTYTAMGLPDSTVFYYDKIIKLIQEEKIKSSEEQHLKATQFLEVVKKESQITTLEKQHEIDVLIENKSRILFCSILFIFFFALATLILLLKRKKREAALQEVALQLKSKDLVNLSLHINEKNQILKEFEEKIEADKNQDSTDKTLYTDVQNTLKKSLKLDEDWQQFEVYLNDLHAGFYSNLKAKHPNLTKTELRVCSLSKLRYTLKESAQTLSISPDSVKSARYRVKKKMYLTAEQN